MSMTNSQSSSATSALQAAANQILAVLAPASARLVRIMVVLENRARTASTDGNIVIIMPPDFHGHPIPDDDAVAVGLLAHEAGHFVQPLEQVLEMEEKHGVPHWLANVALDIHGETFVEGVFPAMTQPLQATRQAVKVAYVATYLSKLETASSFLEAAAYAALMGRFAKPEIPFHPDWLGHRWWNKPWYRQTAHFLDELDNAAYLAPDRIPDFLKSLIRQFPELKQTPLPVLPGYGRTEADRLGQIALGEAQQGSKGCSPGGAGRLQARRFSTEAPEAEALRLSRSIRTRFEADAGLIEVNAPGRIDRHALARGEPLPFRMRLPGRSLPAPQVALCLDISGSMSGRKLILARVAGQAIARSVEANGGHVVGILFSDDGVMAVKEDASPLFAPLREWQPRGGTSFQFLAHVWRRWPQHLVLLLTDGYGAAPTALPADRARTYAVLIAGDPQRIQPIAAQVLELDDLRALPSLLAMLIPRRRR
jgi:hypothetical protein